MATASKYKTWDHPSGKWVVEPGWFTPEGAAKMNRAESIPGTEREVDPSEIDENGRYLPQEATVGDEASLPEIPDDAEPYDGAPV